MRVFYFFRPNLLVILFLMDFLLLYNQAIKAQVSGTVFRDFNANGVKNNSATFNEPFVAGVTVKAYDANDSITTTTTDINGAYAFSGLTLPVRIEFSGYQTGDYSAPWGSGSNTGVQFYSAATSSANLGVNYPSDYCHTENPFVGVNVYRNGDPAAVAVASKNAFYTFVYNSSGNAANKICSVTGRIGAIYGQAYQKQTKFSFVAAYVKRHAGFGPLGIGGIYKINLTDPTTTDTVLASKWINISDTAGLNINVGSVTRVQSTTNINGISDSPTVSSYDADAYLKVGTTGIGDIEFDEAGTTLWLVNLFDRKLYGIQNVNPATSPTAADILGGYDITLPAGYSCNGTLRPFALRPYRGLIYVGAVCDATGATATRADLDAYVLSFDPTNPGAGFSVVTTIPLDNIKNRYNSSILADHWVPWDTLYVNGNQRKATPMLTDIEFDIDGSLILGFRSRTGDMFGFFNNQPVADPNDSTLGNGSLLTVFSDGFGDIMRVCNVVGNFVLEGGSGCPFNATVAGVYDGIYDSATNTTGEYYFGDWGPSDKAFGEVSIGSLAILPGNGQVLSTIFDPVLYHSSGIMTHNNTTGNSTNRYNIYTGQIATNGLFSKANGLGDVELFCNPAPLEIGNRVWSDTDGDGIQDAGEAGIDGVTVQLYEGATLVGTTTTTNGGQWFFNNSNVNQNGATELKPNTAYTIRVPSAAIPSGQTLTGTNTDGTSNGDVRDNDATIAGGNAEIAYTTGSYGQNDHTLDIGFRTAVCDLTLSNIQVSTCNCTTTEGYLDVSGLSNLLPDGVTFGTSGTYNNVPLPGQGTVDISYSYTGTGNTLTPDFRNLDVAQGTTLSTDYTSLGFTGTTVPGLRNKIAANQTGTLTYNFDQPTSNINLLVFDIDWDDAVTVTAIDAHGNPISNFAGWAFNTGDLTDPINAAPAQWNAATGVISSTLNANGERNFAMLTPDVPVSRVVFSFTGTSDTNNNAPHTQYTIYSNLNGEACTATLTADVAWTNAPVGENIVVATGAYTQTINVSGGTTSPQTISMIVPTDGSTNLPITANFATTTTCSGNGIYSLPNCPATCSLSINSVTPSACDSTTNTHNLTLIVSYSNPHTGNILINVGGTIYTFGPVDGTSPDTYTVPGLASDGATGVYVSAAFQDNVLCADSDTYNAPISCTVTCPPPKCVPVTITRKF